MYQYHATMYAFVYIHYTCARCWSKMFLGMEKLHPILLNIDSKFTMHDFTSSKTDWNIIFQCSDTCCDVKRVWTLLKNVRIKMACNDLYIKFFVTHFHYFVPKANEWKQFVQVLDFFTDLDFFQQLIRNFESFLFLLS